MRKFRKRLNKVYCCVRLKIFLVYFKSGMSRRSLKKSMGNSHSQSVSRFTPSLLNGNQKEGRGKKFNGAKFASPENRVLPVPSNVSQRLRSTDNGNILQNGGTISGRKIPLACPESELVQLLQKKCQTFAANC
ncbi:uncharacterized protein CEXT_242331 [Caerostris extrusa]|uniref:Uncharacterized protein n=1 Tax=Caerostris extrusa TaxID=172846 RepID=A0AAV4YBR3_CAEEX|nr:uncharacterized protein CEXT_242331 [Caerostris extrusa]